MTRRRHPRGVVGVMGAALLGGLIPGTKAAALPREQELATDRLAVTAQDFTISPDEGFSFTIGLPAGVDTATLGADGSRSHLIVSSHDDARARDAVRDALDGRPSRTLDSVDISLDLDDADPRVTRPSATEIALSLQTESTADTPDALRFDSWGVFPVTLTLVIDGEAVANGVTFLNRRAGAEPADDAHHDLAVGIVVGETAEPTIAIDGSVAPSAAELADLARLADALAAMDAAGVDAGLGQDEFPPRAALVEPASLAALPDVDEGLAGRLIPLLEHGEVVAQPRVPFDPSSAVAAGQADLYARVLRDGEDTLNNALPSGSVDRKLWLAVDPISGAAVAMLRTIGTQLVIMPFEEYDSLAGSIGRGFTDTSQLMELVAPGGTQMPLMLIDPGFAELISNAHDPPLATAVALVAELIALGRQIDDSGGALTHHGIVLARADGGIPDPELLGAVTRLLLESDGARLVDPSDLSAIVDAQLNDGNPVSVTPRSAAGIDVDSRFAAINDIAGDVLGTASMLPSNEPIVTAWTTVLDAVVSTALTDQEAEGMMRALREQIDVYRNGVQGPLPYTFRVTGQSGKMRFELRNITDVPLTVRITLSSAKLEFDNANRIVELLPQQDTQVDVPFQARSNGTSSVFLRIFTPAPDPSPETQIVPDIILTARVSTLTGLGQLVTGAALLVLCTWWIRHWRQARRRRLADEVAPRHPAAKSRRLALAPAADTPPSTDDEPRRTVAAPGQGGGTTVAADEPADDEGLAPDAAASTLPPP